MPLGAGLDRIENVDSHLDERGDQRRDRPVRMQKHLHLGIGVDPVQSPLVVRHDQFAKHLCREETERPACRSRR